jgi:hypothetical protein
LVVTNQPDPPTQADDELNSGIEGERVGHPGLVNDHQGRRPDPRSPIRQVAVLQGPGEFGERVGADAGLLAEDSSRGGGRGEADHVAGVLGQGRARARMAVVFPAPAGAIVSCSRRPEVHIWRTNAV